MQVCLGDSQLYYRFGRIYLSLLTLFECITGGLDWGEVAASLMKEISPVLGFVFCFYIAFCLFAILNIITGVFVQKAQAQAQEDKDLYLAHHIRDLFFDKVGQGITCEDFREKLENP